MKILNTLTRRKEEFVPINEGKVGIYVCGPTVYDYIHIGNARPMIVFDTLRRYLEYKGYDVNYVSNFTDVDDKIIKRANEEGVDASVISERYIAEVKKDMAALNVREATTHPKATEEIPDMIEMVKTLPIVAVMDTPEEAVKGITDYLIVCFIGIPFITAYNVISSIFRGLGDSKSPMYFIAVACGLNIALDYIFIGVCGMGPLGAALGTTLAQTFSVIISFAAIKRMNTGLKLTRNDFVPRKTVLGEIVKIGLPVAVQDGCIQIAFIVITVIANNRGVNDAAAVGVVEKMISFIFIVPSSMLATVSALAAQNIGAGKHDRAEQVLRYALGIIVAYGVIAIAVVELFAPELVGLFSKNKVVVTMGVQYISSYIVDCVFAGIHFSFTGYFCAYGKSYIGFIHNMIAIVCARIPGSYLASIKYPDTLFPMGFAAPAGSLISIVICVSAFVWMKRRGTLYKANL